jgi:hypothetical protein
VPIGTLAVADDPVADVVDVAAGRQVHDRVGAPAGGPDQLVDLVGHGAEHGRIADVGVDLDQEVAADRHRLQLAVVDVGRDDGAAAGHFLAHELGRHEVGDRGAEVLAVAHARTVLLAAQVLADGDIFHLGGDDAGAGVFQLGDQLAGLGALEIGRLCRELGARCLPWAKPLSSGFTSRGLVTSLDVAARHDQASRTRGRPFSMSMANGRVGVGTRRVVDGHRRLVGRRVDGHLAERHADVGEQ